MPNGKITVSYDSTIARAYAARQVANKLAGDRPVFVRPQADGSCLIVNTPKYENIWAVSRATASKRKSKKGKQ